MTAKGVEREYEHYRTLMSYPLPAGRAYPSSMYKRVESVKGPAFQAGIGRNQVWFTWLCAWEENYLKATALKADAQKYLAASNIKRWPRMSFYRTVVDDPSHVWVREVINPLEKGSSTGVAEDYQATCTSYPTAKIG